MLLTYAHSKEYMFGCLRARVRFDQKPISTIETEQNMNKFRHEDRQNVGSDNDSSFFFVSTFIDESLVKFHEF